MIEQIGRYRVDGELGRGAMGVVYRAHDPAIGRPVAIKTIHLPAIPQPADREKLRHRLRREAQSAGMLSHPNIVTVYDLLEQGDDVFVFMEFVNGPTLESLMNKGELPPPQKLLHWLEGLAAALDFAHSKGIVHRDVKPANVMLHDGDVAKLTDFGVARLNAEASLLADSTQAGTLLGTPNYMSPEQIQGERVDGRADQFSLGVLAYELLTGDRPFTGESVPTLIYKIVNADHLAPRRLNGSLPAEIDAVFHRVLQKQRHYRYPTCRDFITDLEKALAHSPGWAPIARGESDNLPTQVDLQVTPPAPVQLPPARPLETTEEPVRRGRGLVWALLAVSLVAAAGAAWWFSSPPPTPQGAETVKPPEPTVAPTQPEPAKPEPVKTEPAKPKPNTTPAPPPPEETTGAKLHDLHIDSTPDAVAITIDDGRGCLTPCDIQVPAGRHVIKAARDGYPGAERTVEVPAQSTVFLELRKPQGTVIVRTDPAGATILVDGVEWKQRSPARVTLAPGKHKFEFVYPGLPKDEQEVDVKDGVVSTINLNWSIPKNP